MSTLSIHFQADGHDQLKLPLPVHLLGKPGGGYSQRPDSVGQLLGLSKEASAPDDFDDPEQWIDASDLFEGLTENAEEVPVDTYYRGWYPAFMDEDAEIYTVLNPVDRIDVNGETR